VGVPFLASLEEVEHDAMMRELSVFSAVVEYLDKLDLVLPYYRLRESLPASSAIPDLPERPGILEITDQVKRYGWPNGGTWMDQPKDLLVVMQAVELAKSHHENKGKDAHPEITFGERMALDMAKDRDPTPDEIAGALSVASSLPSHDEIMRLTGGV
jgi:hypothetical protein